jgi:alginate O-acetyltransferase complex protein AlgI
MIAGDQHAYHSQLWILYYIYPIHLYADFSALTDIAIGAANLFGVRPPENFALPFFAPSISQYWRRWHMTLTRWLTDYVFTPLRMFTRDLGALGLILSLTLNMVLIGLWHGINSGFLCFGLIHAGYLIADAFTANYRLRLYGKYPAAGKLMTLAGPVIVFHLVALAHIFFRDGTVAGSIYTIRHLLDGVAHPFVSLTALGLALGGARSASAIAALMVFWAVEFAFFLRAVEWKPLKRIPRFANLPRPVRWACYYAAIIFAIVVHQQGTQFIYVQF